MAASVARLIELHKSDAGCLARYHHEIEHPERFEGAPALVGTICHAVVERLTVASAIEQAPAMGPILRATLREWYSRPGFTPWVAEQVVEIMARATGPSSRFRFYLAPGVQVVPEWEWKMDADFQPIPRCEDCNGRGVTDREVAGVAAERLCMMCDGRGWEREAAFGGRVDRLEVGDGVLRVTDYKTVLWHRSEER